MAFKYFPVAFSYGFSRSKENGSIYLYTALIFSFFVWSLFKYFYPFGNFINGDSFAYIIAARDNESAGVYPIGYPMFLRLFSVFSRSDFALVTIQFFLLQASLFYLFITVIIFFSLAKWARNCLFVLLICNPINLYLSNYISSDSFFLSLSLIWFTQLIRIIYKPETCLIITNSIVFFVLFVTRYNALFYPIIAIAAMFISREFLLKKIIGLAISIVLISAFIYSVSISYERLCGIRQFSPFSGWQMANNALYAYRYVDSIKRKDVPARFMKLDQMVRNYFDSTRDVVKHPVEQLKANTVYMWDPSSPLSIYADSLTRIDSTAGRIKRWAYVGTLYNDYGRTLIWKYPGMFLRHFIWPNSVKYYTPPAEFLEQYNGGFKTVNEIARKWFNYKDTKIFTRIGKYYDLQVISYYPIVVGLLNVLVVVSLVAFLSLRLYRFNSSMNKILILGLLLWLCNFLFSVLASPIALRFQLFPVFISILLVVFLLECLVRAAFSEDATQLPRRSKVIGV
ncbi:hypothetical protein J2T02_001966 [Chitinophaga terrae (ex Kim and Jung 2007)]|uniref:hypothetical protein n=1 Tax=Chitinophaga terrae (ex Kim and Jung 2007) TaxID=408074 RepID=UPI002788315B|nr:hypothetical protein [Chitinophaga terrae (ex Kim and Jung 2007)]MDQ0106853.1 hypothetical protein [Chitinophaga terrae (ex Kim and Jung 2007)]